MKLGRAFLKNPEYIAAQLTLGVDRLLRVLRRPPNRAAAQHAQARALLARAVRLIERSTPRDGARRTGDLIREVCAPYFGKADLWKIAGQLA